MIRFNRSMTSPLSLSAALLAASLLAGCGATPRPKALSDARSAFAHSETRELTDLRPKLIREAKGYLDEAERAYERGDHEKAKLYAHLAIQRYATARNYVARDSAKRLGGIMEITRQEAQERQAELERFEELEARISKLGKDIDDSSGDGEGRAAKRALSEARRKQAEAIGAGAPTLAAEEYGEGRTLVESGLESIEMGLFSESTQASARASAAFEKSIASAREKKAGQAISKALRDAQSAAAGSAQADAANRLKAENALTDAATARAAAIAAGAPDSTPGEYQKGTALLASAERRFDSRDYSGTVRLASDATAAFRGAGEKGDTSLASRADIRAAEDARADAIGRGGSDDPLMVRGDFALDVARRALTDRETARASEKAREARGLYAQISGGSSADSPVASRTRSVGGASIRDMAEKKLVELKFQRGELLGQMVDQTCKGPFREFEAILELAQQRWDKADYVQSYEFAVRAQERLRKCTDKPLTATEAKEDAKADVARRKAAVALQKAQAGLAKAQATMAGDANLIQPQQLIKNAEQWFERSEYEQTEALANQAAAILATLKPSAKTKVLEPGDASSAAAAKALQAAQEAFAKVSGKLGEDERLKQPEQLIAASERWYERDAFDRSKELSSKASALLKKLELAKPEAPGAVAKKPTAADACKDAGRLVLESRAMSAKVDEKRLTFKQKSDLKEAKSMVTLAQRRVKNKDCVKGLALAEEANALLLAMPVGSGAKASKPITKPGAAKKPGTKSGAAPGLEGPSGDPWEAAYQRTREALARRDQARPLVNAGTRSSFDKGDAALTRSRSDYKAKRYDSAEREAERAITYFDAVVQAAGGTPSASVSYSGEPAENASLVVQSYAQRAGAAMPRGWKEGYTTVIDALTLRDRAKDAAEDEDKAAMDRGKSHIERARSAWKTRNYFAAKQFAEKAEAEFKRVLAASEKRATAVPAATKAPDDVKDKQAFELADQALREAKVMLTVCEREKCEERDLLEFTGGKEMVKSAIRTFEDGNYAYAERTGKEAAKRLKAVLDKPKNEPEKPPTVDPKKLAAQRQAAEDAVRDATVSHKLCQSRGCDRTDYENWLRAEQMLAGARAAFADKSYERSEQLALETEKNLRAILAVKPSFVIPEGISDVSRSGDRLVLSPSTDFKTASAQMTPASLAPLRSLAKVILANRENIRSVRLIGHTDSQGNAAKNKQLSALRALAVMNSLAQMGVPRNMMSSEGRGSEEPVADNKTKDGRAANRRVEVRFELNK